MSSHKWDIGWDDKADMCIHVCKHCGIKKRDKILHFKGTMKKCGKVTEYFINGRWSSEDDHACVTKTKTNRV